MKILDNIKYFFINTFKNPFVKKKYSNIFDENTKEIIKNINKDMKNLEKILKK